MPTVWTNRIKIILQIIATLIGLLTGGMTAVSIADTIDTNVANKESAVGGSATRENAPMILGNATFAGLATLLFAKAKPIAEWVTKTTGSQMAGGAVYAIGISIQKQQWEATKSPTAKNAIRAAALEIVGSEVFPYVEIDSGPVDPTSNPSTKG